MMGVFPANRECSRLVHGVMRNERRARSCLARFQNPDISDYRTDRTFREDRGLRKNILGVSRSHAESSYGLPHGET